MIIRKPKYRRLRSSRARGGFTLMEVLLVLVILVVLASMAVGVFSMLVVLAVWLRNRSFRWFWIPLAMVPYVGPLFFASPATWGLVNGDTRRSVVG